MDRNAVLAVILISLLMTVWLVWFSPQRPDVAPVDAPLVSDQVGTEALAETDVFEFDTVEPSQSDSAFAAVLAGTERRITVETDRYVAVLSSKGGSLISFQLKDYKTHDQETPIELIEAGSAGALTIEFTSPASHLITTRDIYFDVDVHGDHIDASSTERTLSFSADLGGGQLTLQYLFKPDSYEVVLNVGRRNSERFITKAGYELVWNGGIPFAEAKGSQESTVAASVARTGGELELINLVSDAEERATLNGKIEWVAVRNGFFAVVMIPDQETRGAELEGVRVDDADNEVLANHYTARLFVPDVGAEVDSYRLYLGPIDYNEIKGYDLGLYDLVDYGFGQTITRPIARWLVIPTFHFLSQFVANYGLIIIVFSIFIKLILYPLTKSSFKSMAMMKQLQPEMAEIKEKHGSDPKKQQKAMMRLYKESGVNPIGGCLPQLLQLPILYALFRFFPSAIEIRQQGFLWCTDLSAPDILFELPFTLPIYGDHVSGFPMLMSAAMIVQMRLQGTAQQQQGQMKVMMTIMPIFILVIFNEFAAGLSLYYLMYNLLSALQQKFINKQLDEEAKAKKAKVAPTGKSRKGAKPPKSAKGKRSEGKSKRSKS